MNNKVEQLKIGNSRMFAIIIFCTMITCIALVWAIIFPLLNTENKNIGHQLGIGLILLITGIGGIGFFMVIMPTLRKVEKEFDYLVKNDKKKHIVQTIRKARKINRRHSFQDKGESA